VPEWVLPEPAPLLPEPPATAERRAYEPPALAGIVLRRSDRSPVMFVSVTALGPPDASGSAPILAAAFGKLGSFAFDDRLALEAASQLRFSWPESFPVVDPYSGSAGYNTSNRWLSLQRDLDPAERGRRDLEIELDTGWNIRGNVENEQGAPLARALIGIGGLIVGESAADGRFVVHDLPWDSLTIDVSAMAVAVPRHGAVPELYASQSLTIPAPSPGQFESAAQFRLALLAH
jgi:hypothetical protein